MNAVFFFRYLAGYFRDEACLCLNGTILFSLSESWDVTDIIINIMTIMMTVVTSDLNYENSNFIGQCPCQLTALVHFKCADKNNSMVLLHTAKSQYIVVNSLFWIQLYIFLIPKLILQFFVPFGWSTLIGFFWFYWVLLVSLFL